MVVREYKENWKIHGIKKPRIEGGKKECSNSKHECCQKVNGWNMLIGKKKKRKYVNWMYYLGLYSTEMTEKPK